MALRSGKKTIAQKVMLCKSLASQMRGLMFARQDRNRALIMVFGEEKLVPLHMMFVFFPLDILFLNRKRIVVETFETAKPFITQIRPRHKAKYVIELSAGKIRDSKIRVGDRLSF